MAGTAQTFIKSRGNLPLVTQLGITRMQAWFDFLLLQEKKFGKAAVDKWLRPLAIVRFDSRNLYLEAGDPFCIAWFEEHIRPQLGHALLNTNHQKIKVHLHSKETPSVPFKKKEPPSAPATLPTLSLTSDPLDPRYTLDAWIGSSSTPFITRLCDELLQNASSKISLGTFNPILFYGPSGSGKTHLLMALAQALKQKGLNVLYVRSDTFTHHVVHAIRLSSMPALRTHYRSADVLLIDDLHLLARRFATQEEFFHTFNSLHIASKQMIFTSQLPPALMEEIEPRLISRFEWGIAMALEPLEEASLRKMLEQKSRAFLCPLEPAALDFIIEHFPKTPLAIQRALEALVLRRHLHRVPADHLLTSQETASFLNQLLSQERVNAVTPSKIIAAVANQYGIRSEDILGPSHAQEYAQPRQIAMYLCRSILKLPFMKIGDVFSRDHSTVITSVKQVQRRLDQKEGDLATALHTIQRNFIF